MKKLLLIFTLSYIGFQSMAIAITEQEAESLRASVLKSVQSGKARDTEVNTDNAEIKQKQQAALLEAREFSNG